ncbi:MAG: glycosyltransferase [Bacteroidota bacterium]|nr:glycosyltransferase [Bacteroidota bacterium]
MVAIKDGDGGLPLVSVSCMTYNHAPFIRQCLDPILGQQTNFPFEIVIHDDASTDGTKEIIEEYVARHPGIIFPIFQQENQYSKGIRGIPSRYNYPRCRGKYIAVCEGDDYWTDPLQLQKQVDFLEMHDDYVMTYHDMDVVDQNGIILQQDPIHPRHKRDASQEDLILGRRVPMTLTLCFRNVIKEFPPEKNKVTNGDTFLVSLLGQYGKGKWLGDEIGNAMYRSHSGGVWSMVSSNDKLPVRVNTFYWLYSYYNRIGKKAYALKWYGKILYTVMMFEPDTSAAHNSYYTDGSNVRPHSINMLQKTFYSLKLLSRKILFTIAFWLK